MKKLTEKKLEKLSVNELENLKDKLDRIYLIVYWVRKVIEVMFITFEVIAFLIVLSSAFGSLQPQSDLWIRIKGIASFIIMIVWAILYSKIRQIENEIFDYYQDCVEEEKIRKETGGY